jgi:hypothetical protein
MKNNQLFAVLQHPSVKKIYLKSYGDKLLRQKMAKILLYANGEIILLEKNLLVWNRVNKVIIAQKPSVVAVVDKNISIKLVVLFLR